MKRLKFIVQNFRRRPYVLAFMSHRNYDDLTIDEEIKTTWDKIRHIFKRDAKQNLSPELCTILSNAVGGLFIGSGYAGFLQTRVSIKQFIDANMATKFHNQMDARFRLQDTVNLHFMRAGARWGIRISFFTTMFTTMYTILGVYREKHSAWNLVPAGIMSGAIYKISLGPKGMIAGGVGGGILSLLAASLISVLLKLSGTTFDDHYKFNYMVVNERDRTATETRKSQPSAEPIKLLGEKDAEQLLKEIDLIETKTEKTETKVETEQKESKKSEN